MIYVEKPYYPLLRDTTKTADMTDWLDDPLATYEVRRQEASVAELAYRAARLAAHLVLEWTPRRV